MSKKTCNVKKKKKKHSPAYPASYAGCDHPRFLALLYFQLLFNSSYYMAESTSGQDDANPVFRLAIRAGKMFLLARSGFPVLVPQKKLCKKCTHVINAFFD